MQSWNVATWKNGERPRASCRTPQNFFAREKPANLWDFSGGACRESATIFKVCSPGTGSLFIWPREWAMQKRSAGCVWPMATWCWYLQPSWTWCVYVRASACVRASERAWEFDECNVDVIKAIRQNSFWKKQMFSGFPAQWHTDKESDLKHFELEPLDLASIFNRMGVSKVTRMLSPGEGDKRCAMRLQRPM